MRAASPLMAPLNPATPTEPRPQGATVDVFESVDDLGLMLPSSHRNRNRQHRKQRPEQYHHPEAIHKSDWKPLNRRLPRIHRHLRTARIANQKISTLHRHPKHKEKTSKAIKQNRMARPAA